MSKNRNILFLTGTRADFGKLRSLIERVDNSEHFTFSLFVTGMHVSRKYGYTVNEVYKALKEEKLSQGPHSVYTYMNQTESEPMEQVLANTITGLSRYVAEFEPDLIVVHGDRVEALAGAIVGALRNIYVVHIEGGERSGTIDEVIRHAVTKLSHIHFVANEEAAKRLKQLGETDETIHVIGSPDIDLMLSPNLPIQSEVKARYNITFEEYAILIFHPITTRPEETATAARNLVRAVSESKTNFIVIYPNNDAGSEIIFRDYQALEDCDHICMFPSMRFQHFLTLLKNSRFILGNSSAGVREAPVYGVPSVNVGTRQNNRFKHHTIFDVSEDQQAIETGITKALEKQRSEPCYYFGEGCSADNFLAALESEALWNAPMQKQFIDMDFYAIVHAAITENNRNAATEPLE